MGGGSGGGEQDRGRGRAVPGRMSRDIAVRRGTWSFGRRSGTTQTGAAQQAPRSSAQQSSSGEGSWAWCSSQQAHHDPDAVLIAAGATKPQSR